MFDGNFVYPSVFVGQSRLIFRYVMTVVCKLGTSHYLSPWGGGGGHLLTGDLCGCLASDSVTRRKLMQRILLK